MTMNKLAYYGGKPTIKTPIKPLNSISERAFGAVSNFMSDAELGRTPLSGYLAGSERGGGAVQRLEQIWSQTFGINHSIACNSCTSAIFAAIAVLDPKAVHIPVMGMSAIAACPKVLGKEIRFWDIDEHYGIQTPKDVKQGDLILAVNLFGHPAQLRALGEHADARGAYLVEDNAQGLFATENNMYAGTVGHISCWSGNVHKPLNAGELGILTTNDYHLSKELRAFINHGEMSGHRPGMNLRCQEVTAIIALAQLDHARNIVKRCREIWYGLRDTYYDEIFEIPNEREDCESAWYCIPLLVPTKAIRDFAVQALNAEGLPCRAGYVMLPQIEAFQHIDATYEYAGDCDARMVLIETASIDPTDEQITQMSNALLAVGEEIYAPSKSRSRNKR